MLNLKVIILDKLALPIAEQVLSYCGKPLENKNTLSSYHITENGSTIHCSLRLKATLKRCIVHFENKFDTKFRDGRSFVFITADGKIPYTFDNKRVDLKEDGSIKPWMIEYNDNTSVEDLIKIINQADC